MEFFRGNKSQTGQNICRIRRISVLTQPPTLLPLGEVLEAVGGAALCLLMLLDVPRQFGGDVSDKEAARPQTVIVASHSELTLLQKRQISAEIHGSIKVVSM